MFARSFAPAQGELLDITVIVLDSLLLSIAAVAICIRLWSRKIQGLGLYLNDYAAVLAWPLAAGLVIISILVFHDGGGQHIKYVDPAKLPEILKSYIAADVAWAATNTSIKVSIVHFYITVFRSNRTFRKVAHAVVVLVIAFGVGVVVASVLICIPTARFWHPSLSGTCGNLLDFLLAFSICNLFIDLTIILLPIPMVWLLQMSRRRKIELTVTFTLGLVVCAITLIRVVLASQLRMDDYTDGIARIGIVTTLEPILGIIVACLPIFPPALKVVFGHVKRVSPETHYVISSSVAQLRLRRSKSSPFEKFDEYLLTDIENQRIEQTISGPSNKSDFSGRGSGRPAELAEGEFPPLNSITIRHDWEVRSESARNSKAHLQLENNTS